MAKNHYVNNKEFLEALIKRRSEIEGIEKLDRPGISDYLGKCIYDICTHLSYKPNFINYSFRHEMISDALENCLVAIDSFNPEKSSNPFSYFTQVAFFAFLRRIEIEKNQSYIKGKLIENLPMEDLIEFDDDGNSYNIIENLREHYHFDTVEYEKKKQLKKDKKAAAEKLETFMGE